MLAGLMMEPLFGSRLPDVMNLAAYGFVIGVTLRDICPPFAANIVAVLM
jgi:hypothetical protein